MILTNARILTFDRDDRVIDSGSVEVGPDGTIGAVQRGAMKGANTIDAGGRLLMPALINCHSHLYSTFARGIPLTGAPPANFPEILQKLWWRLDRALSEEDIYYSALVGLIDSARNGVGVVIDHHSSPNACAGSLDMIERAFHKVGLRGATCYETSDRDGKAATAAAIAENVRFLENRRPGGLVAGAFGLHAAFTLSDRTLRQCVEANERPRAPFHVHLSEDICDRGAATRLYKAGIFARPALAAHAVHVTAAERKLLARRAVSVVHCPQSNANNRVGVAPVGKMLHDDVLVGLGSDGYTPRLWEELKASAYRDPVELLRNNRPILNLFWATDTGCIETGARADLALYDYFPPTPLRAANLGGHLLFGVANAPVNSLMVNGRWVVRERQCVTVDERKIAAKASRLARALWERF